MSIDYIRPGIKPLCGVKWLNEHTKMNSIEADLSMDDFDEREIYIMVERKIGRFYKRGY